MQQSLSIIISLQFGDNFAFECPCAEIFL